jgi:hypothetical protein
LNQSVFAHESAIVPLSASCITSEASVFVNTLELKSLYTGEIAGMLDFIHHTSDSMCKFFQLFTVSGTEDFVVIQKLSQVLLSRFKAVLADAPINSSHTSPTDAKQFNTLMYRTTAFVISQTRKVQYLL